MFTSNLLVKKLSVTPERAEELLQLLKKYRLLSIQTMELDDAEDAVYRFSPSPSFVSLLIFAREMIERPRCFNHYMGGRNLPYLV